MSSSINTSFFERFPGPYWVEPGTDGVDDTFDIMCRSTGHRIIASTYWYEEEQAKLVADVVTLALELSAPYVHRATANGTIYSKLRRFQEMHQGPYFCKEYIHDSDTAEIGVASPFRDVLIISTVATPGDEEARQIVGHIATALNRLFGHAGDSAI